MKLSKGLLIGSAAITLALAAPAGAIRARMGAGGLSPAATTSAAAAS